MQIEKKEKRSGSRKTWGRRSLPLVTLVGQLLLAATWPGWGPSVDSRERENVAVNCENDAVNLG